MNWKFFARMAAVYIRQAGEEYKAKDANTTGKDDLIGVSLVYAADLIESVISDKPVPKAPEALK